LIQDFIQSSPELKKNIDDLFTYGARISQPVQQLNMGWTTEGSEFEFWQGQEFSLLHIDQTGSGAYPVSCQMNTKV
jgi:hypothetical protein